MGVISAHTALKIIFIGAVWALFSFVHLARVLGLSEEQKFWQFSAVRIVRRNDAKRSLANEEPRNKENRQTFRPCKQSSLF